MKEFLRTKDHSVTGEAFTLLLDEDMEMLRTEPIPPNVDRYYESDAYISHTDAQASIIEKLYQIVKRRNLQGKVKLITRNNKTGKRLLDFGAGTGDFLVTAKEKGWEIEGVEPSPIAQENARKKGLRLCGSVKELQNKKFDVITLWHVLEHVPNLEEQIGELEGLLANDGTLIVAVPNFRSYDAKRYGTFWAAYDVPRHVWHFSRNAIPKLFQKVNLEVVATRPMFFDSFYVSLLSEKYKTGQNRYLSAFWNGLKSNLKASRTKEYSSVIYILRRKEA